MIIRCSPGNEDMVRKKLEARGMTDVEVQTDPALKDDQITVIRRGKTALDTGYVYAPYIPMQVTPTFEDENIRSRARKTPLQEAMEKIFKEEIESGELKPIWNKPPIRLFDKKWVVYKDPPNTNFFGVLDITNM